MCIRDRPYRGRGQPFQPGRCKRRSPGIERGQKKAVNDSKPGMDRGQHKGYVDGGFTNAKEFIHRFVLTDQEDKKLFYDSKTILHGWRIQCPRSRYSVPGSGGWYAAIQETWQA